MERRNFLSVSPRLALQNHAYENGLMNSRILVSSNPTIGAGNQNSTNSIFSTNHAPFGLGQIGLNQRSTEVRKTYVTPYGIQVHHSVIDHSQINDQLITTVTEVSTTKFILPSQPNFQNHNPSIRPSILNAYHQPMLNNVINSIDDHAGQSNGVALKKPRPVNTINKMVEIRVQRPSGDGRTHSLPHKKYGPYKCPRCKCVFKISQQFAAHMLTHYKDESVEERKRRLEAKYKIKKPRLVCSNDGLTKAEVSGDNGVKKEEGSNHGGAICSNVNGANVDAMAEEQTL